jgi:hypothetical protein
MLNGELAETLARQWAGKLLIECGDDEPKLIRDAFADAYGRVPTEQEIKAAEDFVKTQSAAIAEEGATAVDQLPIPMPKSSDRAKGAAIVDFCHAIFCSNEFMYVD